VNLLAADCRPGRPDIDRRLDVDHQHGYAKQQKEAGKILPALLIDHQRRHVRSRGAVRRSPGRCYARGLDAGHRIRARSVDRAMTGGLADTAAPTRPKAGASVFIQVLDPKPGGLPPSGGKWIILADGRAGSARGRAGPAAGRARLARYREVVANGVALYPAILPGCKPGDKYGVSCRGNRTSCATIN
jgi:hypothetical protein